MFEYQRNRMAVKKITSLPRGFLPVIDNTYLYTLYNVYNAKRVVHVTLFEEKFGETVARCTYKVWSMENSLHAAVDTMIQNKRHD